ncbi:MAG: hypothetical protein J7521_11200 [Caulobacter sp.]|nr:hypothetical protein [Caulobacter sp.]
MKTTAWCVVASLAATCALTPAPVLAQRSDRYAIDACSSAVDREIGRRYSQAGRTQLLSNDTRSIGYDETGVSGRAQFADNGGWTQFNYDCIYNARTGATYGLDIRNLNHGSSDDDKKKNANAAAAVIVGALLAGAIVASAKKKDRHDDDRSWSPSRGVECYPRESACYENGSFSRYWTKRIYYR